MGGTNMKKIVFVFFLIMLSAMSFAVKDSFSYKDIPELERIASFSSQIMKRDTEIGRIYIIPVDMFANHYVFPSDYEAIFGCNYEASSDVIAVLLAVYKKEYLDSENKMDYELSSPGLEGTIKPGCSDEVNNTGKTGVVLRNDQIMFSNEVGEDESVYWRTGENNVLLNIYCPSVVKSEQIRFWVQFNSGDSRIKIDTSFLLSKGIIPEYEEKVINEKKVLYRIAEIIHSKNVPYTKGSMDMTEIINKSWRLYQAGNVREAIDLSLSKILEITEEEFCVENAFLYLNNLSVFFKTVGDYEGFSAINDYLICHVDSIYDNVYLSYIYANRAILKLSENDIEGSLYYLEKSIEANPRQYKDVRDRSDFTLEEAEKLVNHWYYDILINKYKSTTISVDSGPKTIPIPVKENKEKILVRENKETDLKNGGFRDINWGSTLTQVKSKASGTVVGETEADGLYIYIMKERIFGEEAKVTYTLIDNKLFLVTISLEGSLNNDVNNAYKLFNEVSDVLKDKYGEPYFENEGWLNELYKNLYKNESPDSLAMLMNREVYKPVKLWTADYEGTIDNFLNKPTNSEFSIDDITQVTLDKLDATFIMLTTSGNDSGYLPSVAIDVMYTNSQLLSIYNERSKNLDKDKF